MRTSRPGMNEALSSASPALPAPLPLPPHTKPPPLKNEPPRAAKPAPSTLGFWGDAAHPLASALQGGGSVGSTAQPGSPRFGSALPVVPPRQKNPKPQNHAASTSRSKNLPKKGRIRARSPPLPLPCGCWGAAGVLLGQTRSNQCADYCTTLNPPEQVV